MSVAAGLIAMGVGYLVFSAASKEKEGLKILGQIIGIFVMAVSVLTILCSSMHCLSKSQCPLMGKHECSMMKNECPMMSKSSGASAVSAEEK
jgi:hypothetical protein